MAEKDKKYYWLKLKRDFFKRHDIRIIESMPNGKDYILFYLKLLCESVDHEGNLRFSDEIPYNEEMLSTITNTNIDIVRSAIKVFSQLNMMEVLDDGTYHMQEVKRMIGCETKWAEKKRKYREQKMIESGQNNDNASLIEDNVQQVSDECPTKEDNVQSMSDKSKSKSKSKNIYTSVVDGFTDNQDLKTSIYDFIEMRKLIKKPMSEQAVKIMLNKLSKLASDDETQIKILEQSIEHSWQSVYELKEEKKVNGIKVNKEEDDILDGIL